MVDVRAVLEVLSGIGEVEAEELGLPAGGGVADVGVEADDVAAEGDDDVLELRVLADDRIVLAEVL